MSPFLLLFFLKVIIFLFYFICLVFFVPISNSSHIFPLSLGTQFPFWNVPLLSPLKFPLLFSWVRLTVSCLLGRILTVVSFGLSCLASAESVPDCRVSYSAYWGFIVWVQFSHGWLAYLFPIFYFISAVSFSVFYWMFICCCFLWCYFCLITIQF